MIQKLIFFICSLVVCIHSFSQTSDEAYREPLKQVLTEIEQQYGIQIKYKDTMVSNRWVTYARWRFRTDVEKTLENVLASQDLSFTKLGDKRYKLNTYKYHLKTVEEGKAQLEYLSSLYHDVASWENRKAAMRACMYSALQLSPMPAAPASKPIVTPVRKMDGYTVENIAFEVLPGVYTCGSLYRPAKIKGKVPVILCPDGHWDKHRYRADCQYRCATLARMGCIAISYDLFAWGESMLQFKYEDHQHSLAMTVQTLGAFRILDYLLQLKEADTSRVAISGGSGGGNHTILMAALDDRIKLSAPVVSLSSYHSGGCPCESGMPVHFCGGGTNNAELAAMAAPHPQLVISDGKDWTATVPEIEFPYLKKMYGYYGKQELVENVHLPEEDHDFGINKRIALYEFIGKYFHCDMKAVKDQAGKIDESKVTIEPQTALYVFGEHGEKLPVNAIHGFDKLKAIFEVKK
ncbi:acetylxylan esterase [Niastella vici]|uniref:Acetylxylan esterase n=1 Tax=Niastella vici TaxID=1703345 RepID=A0A1V9G767_9BACT|nr:acetylxylan esterase [Niastella vici]OQP66402.1 acetylxylan esterase [Niastella vici]